MKRTHTNTQVQKLVSSKHRVETVGETYGQTDATHCVIFPANAVGNGGKVSCRKFEFRVFFFVSRGSAAGEAAAGG